MFRILFKYFSINVFSCSMYVESLRSILFLSIYYFSYITEIFLYKSCLYRVFDLGYRVGGRRGGGYIGQVWGGEFLVIYGEKKINLWPVPDF